MVMFAIVKFFVKIWYFIMFDVTVLGRENVPKEGNAVICANHFSAYDPLSAAIYLKRLPRFMAKKELFDSGLGRWFFGSIKVFPVDREAVMDMKAFKMALNVLKSGEMLGIFAEGTRVKEGEDKEAKGGAALFALKGNAPIIPVAISGEFKFRSKVVIEYGEPMGLAAYRGQKITTDLLAEATQDVMERIQEMRR
ncbi:lysophospholipid acyltransferase family protein [Chakrabartyella piscis]|uniref:lysophospholipid acyltransferase family protein n=1 Tax=Chakrabartyella piscis TaxID=2918914 RepID=UPI002958A47F|nr:lysophospholipid acyltransferase family protein [Chakrabartyella piscis]